MPDAEQCAAPVTHANNNFYSVPNDHVGSFLDLDCNVTSEKDSSELVSAVTTSTPTTTTITFTSTLGLGRHQTHKNDHHQLRQAHHHKGVGIVAAQKLKDKLDSDELDPDSDIELATIPRPNRSMTFASVLEGHNNHLHSTSSSETLNESSLGRSTRSNSFATSTVPSALGAADRDACGGGGEVKRRRIKRYLTVAGAFLALFCTFGQMNSFGTYHSWYSRNQLDGMSHSKISWIGSLQLWVFFFSGGFIGRIFDSYGPRALMLVGTLLYTLSVMTTSISTRYYEFMLSQGLLFGLSVGLLFYPSLASVSTHFLEYRATALGIAAAGSSVGGVLYPIVLEYSFKAVGFAWGVRISGLAGIVGCFAATLMVSTKQPPQAKGGPMFDVRSILDVKFAFLVVGCCLVALGLFSPFFFIVEYARHLSIPSRTALYVLAIMNLGGVFGRVAPAYLSDRIGRFNLLFPSAFFSGLSCLVGWLVVEAKSHSARSGYGVQDGEGWNGVVIGVMVFAGVYGFFSGAFISLITPCVAQISESREIGTRIGMLYTLISVPSLIGGPTAGALLGYEHGSYTGMIVFSGSTVIFGSLFILFSKLAIDRSMLARV